MKLRIVKKEAIFLIFSTKKALVLTKALNLHNGGADEDRTRYLLNANQALSQVSYGPKI
jgi:hypothetical protein